MYCQTDEFYTNTQRGKWLTGLTTTIQNNGAPSLGFSSEKRKFDDFETDRYEKTFTLNLSPKVGYLLWRNLALGLEGSLGIVAIRDDGFAGSDINGTTWNVGPFARYYIGTKSMRPFVEAGVFLGHEKFIFDDPDPRGFDITFKDNTFTYGGGAGVAFILGNKFSLDALIVYNRNVTKEIEDNPDNERTIVSGVFFKLGFSLYLN